MTGISGTNYLVNDPGFTKTSYTQAEVVKSGIYTRPAGCASLESAIEELNLSSTGFLSLE